MTGCSRMEHRSSLSDMYQDQIVKFQKQGHEGEPSWLADARSAAYERFKEIGLPTRKSESWKYVNLAPVLDADFESPSFKCFKFSSPRNGINFFLPSIDKLYFFFLERLL